LSWTKTDLIPKVPDEINQFLTGVSTFAGKVSTALDIVSTALGIAKALYKGATDPFKALLGALIDELEKLIIDLFSTGVHAIVVQPFNLQPNVASTGDISLFDAENMDDIYNLSAAAFTGAPIQYDEFGIPTLTPGETINKAIDSFGDSGDLNRPVFTSSSNVTGFGIMVTAPGVGPFATILEGLTSVFGYQEFLDLLNRLLRMANLETGGSLRPISTNPDWIGFTLKSIPLIDDTRKLLLKVLAMLKGFLQAEDPVIALIEIIEKKVEALNDIVKDFQELVDQFKAALNATGIYVLDIPESTGGTEYIKESLRDDAMSDLVDNKYTAMILFVAGTLGTAGIEDAIEEILAGESYDNEQARQDAEDRWRATLTARVEVEEYAMNALRAFKAFFV